MADPDNSWDGILQEDEILLWQGQPEALISLRDLDWPGALTGAFFTIFAIVWMRLAAQPGGLFWVFGLIFLFVGLRKSLGQLLIDPWIRQQTWYSLTNKRAFVASRHPLKGKTLKSYVIDRDSSVELQSGSTDALKFGVEERFGTRGGCFHREIRFENLADGRVPYGFLLKIQQGDV